MRNSGTVTTEETKASGLKRSDVKIAHLRRRVRSLRWWSNVVAAVALSVTGTVGAGAIGDSASSLTRAPIGPTRSTLMMLTVPLPHRDPAGARPAVPSRRRHQ